MTDAADSEHSLPPPAISRADPDPVDLLQLAVEALDERLGRVEAALQESSARLEPDELPEWVDWLKETYALDTGVPADWPDIPGVVEELTALRSAHAAAYRADGQPRAGFVAVQWHEAFTRTLDRVDHWVKAQTRRSNRGR